jgi:hypothetical protein
MPNQHKNPSIGWNSADSTLKPWVEAEAERRGITKRELLDEALAEYRKKAEHARSVDVSAANRAISTALETARDTTQTTETDGETR